MVGDKSQISDASGSALRRGGLAFRIGPVAARIQITQAAVRNDFLALYDGYPLSPPNRIVDFHLRVRPASAGRRWVRPNVIADTGGVNTPFVPLPRDLGLLAVEAGMNWLMGSSVDSFLLFHAGLAARDGRAVLMPGASGAGKSTLSAGLGLSGWQLLSDEFALLRPETNRFWPYPRPVSLKNESGTMMRERFPGARFSRPYRDTPKGTITYMQPPPASLLAMDEPAVPALVLFPEYRPGDAPRAMELRPVEAFAMLRSAAVNSDRLGAIAFTAVARLATECRAFRLIYRSLAQGMAMVNDLMDETP